MGAEVLVGTTVERPRSILGLNAPTAVHLGVLVAAFATFAIVAARSWFFYDDWYFLRDLTGELFTPHVGHWNSVPTLVFQTIERIFGIDYYLPFAIPAILAHLGVVHLLWRISIRAGVQPWIATAFSVLMAFLGAGAEALAWAVQIGFVGAITGMLWCILLLDTPRLSLRRASFASVLVLLSVATSGSALPLILIAVILCWIRHGAFRSIAVFAIPGIAYIVWFLLEGITAARDGRASGLSQLLAVPQFAVSMLTDGVGRVFPVAVIGSLVFVSLGVWWLFSIRSVSRATLVIYLLFIVALLFALLTGYSRIGNGLHTATSSRYVYVVMVCISPLMALGLQRLSRRSHIAPGVAIVLIIAAWNMGGVAVALTERIHRTDSTRAQLAQTVAVMKAFPGCFNDTDRPSPEWAPDVTVADLRHWLDRGWYRPDGIAVSSLRCDR